MEEQEIKQAWGELMPNSLCTVNGGYIKLYIAVSPSEEPSNYLDNDALFYTGFIDKLGNYKETGLRLYIKPVNKYCLYGSATIRRKSIKNVNFDKLRARFEQIKQLIVDNKDNFINLKYDINSKL